MRGNIMDSKKIFAICVAVIFVVAAIVVVVVVNNNNNNGGGNPEVVGELSVSYLKKSGYETQMVADQKNFFADFGLKVSSVAVTGSGQDAVNLMLSGEVDIASTGEGPVANTIHNYPENTVIVCGTNRSTGGQVWVSSSGTGLVAYDKTKDNKAEVLNSFKEASSNGTDPVKVGVQQGATTESEFKSWMKAMGIPFSDFESTTEGAYVKLVNLKANTLVSALATGSIDMMAASQPYPSQALKQVAGSFKVGSNEDINSYGLNMYITTKAIYNEKRDLIERFIRGLDKASDYMIDNEEECVTICAKVIDPTGDGSGYIDTVQAEFDIANWGVKWSDEMANTLFKTCQKKSYTEITEAMCKDLCPFQNIFG